MLQIRMISGETSIPADEIHDVRGLKRRLNQLHGFPLGFRQRFLLDGEILEDTVKLDSPMDLDLVLLPFVEDSKEQADELVYAAAHGDMAKIGSNLQLPQDPDSCTARGITALMMASNEGHTEIVSLLLAAGANANLVETTGSTALIAASNAGHVEVVSLLLDAGADTDVVDKRGMTALIMASDRGHAAVVSLLLDAGADSNVATHTALMSACFQGDVDIVNLLLKAGVDKDATETTGCTALMIAAYGGHVDVVSSLLKAGANKDLASDNGSTALMKASSAGHSEVVNLLQDSTSEATTEPSYS